MNDTASTQQELVKAFAYLDGHVRVQRDRRLWADVDYPHFAEVFDHAIYRLGFTMLCTITGTDEGERLGALYHLADNEGTVLTIKTTVPRTEPLIHTVINRFPAAEIYERELIDLLGFNVTDLPEGKRYPLPDDWPAGEYPLRKDWKG